MGNRFASGKNSIAECDRCGQRYKLKLLKREVIKTKLYDLLVCPECWDPDHPQLQLGMYPVDDPQAVRNPRKDVTYVTSGYNANGNPSMGSRDIQWGWNPVGGSKFFDDGMTPNTLVCYSQIGQVTVSAPYPTTPTIYYSAVTSGLLQAALRRNPGYTAFRLTTIGGRMLGDIDNSGSVTTADPLIYQRWTYGGLTDPAQVQYIEQTLNPYILANPTAYAPYIIP